MEEELRSAEDADRRKKEEDRLRELALAAPPAAIEAPALPAAAENPIPEEGHSPPLTASEIQTGAGYPRIQPPSTGEQVSAGRPNPAVAAVEAEANTGSDAAPSALPDEAPAEETA